MSDTPSSSKQNQKPLPVPLTGNELTLRAVAERSARNHEKRVLDGSFVPRGRNQPILALPAGPGHKMTVIRANSLLEKLLKSDPSKPYVENYLTSPFEFEPMRNLKYAYMFQQDRKRKEALEKQKAAAKTKVVSKKVHQPRPLPPPYSVTMKDREITIFDDQDGVTVLLKQLKAIQYYQTQNGGSEMVVVGLDARWLDCEGSIRVALLTISVEDEIFIVDLMSLRAKKNMLVSNPWMALDLGFFQNEKVLKLGYKTEEVMRVLEATSKYWSDLRWTTKFFLDLGRLSREISLECLEFFPQISGKRGGLSELVRLCVGKPFVDSQTDSNWEARPLTEAQIHSTVTRACAFVDIFIFLVRRGSQLNMDLEEMAVEILSRMDGEPVPVAGTSSQAQAVGASGPGTPYNTEKITFPEGIFRRPSPTRAAKLLCDVMFSDLGKLLRVCGFDTLIMSPMHSANMCVGITYRDGRTIITTPAKAKEYVRSIPAKRIIKVKSSKLFQQLDDVLRNYKVTVCEAELFSRCRFCNGGTFTLVRNKTMKGLKEMDQNPMRNSKLSETELEHFGVVWIPMYSVTELEWKSWKLLNEASLITKDKSNITTSMGVPIRFNALTPHYFHNPDCAFVICNACGKIYYCGLPPVTQEELTPIEEPPHRII